MHAFNRDTGRAIFNRACEALLQECQASVGVQYYRVAFAL